MNRIAAKYVYTLEGFEPIEEGFVEFDDDGVVTAVGKCEDYAAEPEVFDGAIVPGFVNAHCHVELSHLEGRFSKGSGMAGFIDQINSLRDCVPAEEKKVLLRAQMEKMWSEGVSALADISNCSDSFEAKRDSSIYTRTFLEVFGTEPEDCASVIAGARGLEALAAQYGIDASITPHSCYTTCPQLLTAASAEALRTGFLSYHSQESRQEEDMIRYGRGELYDNRIREGMSVPPATGTSSLEYFLTRLGFGVTNFTEPSISASAPPATVPFVADAPPTSNASGSSTPVVSSLSHATVISTDSAQTSQTDPSALPTLARDANILLVHNVCVDREAAEKALAVLKNVYWALCPLSNIFIHNALPPVPMMRELGLNLCIGTDSLSSNDSLDMVGEIRCLQENFPEIPLGELLTWACLNGARFLRKDGILGTIAVGKRPGLVGISALAPADTTAKTASTGSETLTSDTSLRLTPASRSTRLV